MLSEKQSSRITYDGRERDDDVPDETQKHLPDGKQGREPRDKPDGDTDAADNCSLDIESSDRRSDGSSGYAPSGPGRLSHELELAPPSSALRG